MFGRRRKGDAAILEGGRTFGSGLGMGGVATKPGEAPVLFVTSQRAGHSKMVHFSNYFLNSGTSKKNKNLNDGFSSFLESPLTHRITGHTAKFILHAFTKPPSESNTESPEAVA